MDASSTQRLIKKMLASRDLMPETREDLEEHLADLERGALHPDDARYIEGLARRLGLADGGTPPAGGGSGGDDRDDDDDDDSFMGNQRASDTATAVQAEMALRKVEQARELLGQLRQPADALPDAPARPAAETATLDEIEQALAEAAATLRRNA